MPPPLPPEVLTPPAGAPIPAAGEAAAARPPAGPEPLRFARWLMIAIGSLAVVTNACYFASAERIVQEQIDREVRALPRGYVADPVQVADLKAREVRANRWLSAGGFVLGLLFLGCAAGVRRRPVPMTVAGLGLYLGGNALFAVVDPSTLASGLPIKILVVAALIWAVQTAIARTEPADGPGT